MEVTDEGRGRFYQEFRYDHKRLAMVIGLSKDRLSGYAISPTNDRPAE